MSIPAASPAPLPLLRPAPLEWLLDPSDPSARLYALRELLERSDDDAQVRQLRLALEVEPRITATFARQRDDGGFGDLEGDDAPEGTAFALSYLLLLGISPRDPRLVKAARAFVKARQVPESTDAASPANATEHPDGAFSTSPRSADVASCTTGDALALSLTLLGPIEENRRAVLWLLRTQRHDGGWLHCRRWSWKRKVEAKLRPSHSSWPEESDPSVRSCRFGTYRALRALATLPDDLRDANVRRALTRGAEYFLARGVTGSLESPGKDLQPRIRTFNRGFAELGTPLRQQLDMLAVARLLVDLGYATDSRLAPTLERIRDLQGDDGRWRCATTLPGMLGGADQKEGEPSKWITVDALSLLRRVARSHGAELTMNESSGLRRSP